MNCKTFEIRDRGTFITALAVQLTPADERDRWILARAGYGTTAENQGTYVLLINLTNAPHDPHGHNTGARTLPIAHHHIIDNFSTLKNGAVIDVEFIRGESETKKVSEQETD